jgi:hypothetical protein
MPIVEIGSGKVRIYLENKPIIMRMKYFPLGVRCQGLLLH